MAKTTLPPFPVDDATLDLIESALASSFVGWAEDGPLREPGQFGLDRVLEFLSGYDPTLCVPLLNEYDTELPDAVEYTGTLYSEADVMRALIGEVRRLRG